ncbi:MAG: hypothetical protein H6747_09795 [Deltaproteobacteria bacterium]|nr:hypothetical protein [Deltaproteobacteria bacterium]
MKVAERALPPALGLAGVAAVLGALQAEALLVFADPWLAWWPRAAGLLGVVAIVASVRMVALRPGARALALAALLPIAIGGPPFAWALLGRGIITGMAWLGPLFATTATLLLALGWRDHGARLATATQLRADAAEWGRGPRDADDLGEPPPPPGLPLAFHAALAMLLLPFAALVLAIASPPTFSWLEVRSRGLLAGRMPFANAFVATADRYPYSGSPYGWYLAEEARFVALDQRAALAFADTVAEEVTWQLAAETGISDVRAAERALWAAGDGAAIPRWIAAALRRHGVVYHEESLFSRSFDPKLHLVPGTVHMDCDQLVYLFLHVAWRLDLQMLAMPAPLHLYLRYNGPDGEVVTVETTRFRPLRRRRGTAEDDSLGEGFLIDEDHYSSGRAGAWASADLIRAAGLYTPWTERDIRDAVLANVLVGLRSHRIEVDFVGESESRLDGTRDITLVANLYGYRVDQAKQALSQQDDALAREHALAARELRRRFGPLVVRTAKVEEDVLRSLDEAAEDPAPR